MNGALPANLNPLAFILMAGTNNAGLCRDNPVHIADGVLRIIELLDAAAPNAPIILYPIFPRGHRPNAVMRKITNKANDSLLARLPRRRKLIVRDLRAPFLDARRERDSRADAGLSPPEPRRLRDLGRRHQEGSRALTPASESRCRLGHPLVAPAPVCKPGDGGQRWVFSVEGINCGGDIFRRLVGP